MNMSLFTVEQIELIRRLRVTGVTAQQIVEAFQTMDRMDLELGCDGNEGEGEELASNGYSESAPAFGTARITEVRSLASPYTSLLNRSRKAIDQQRRGRSLITPSVRQRESLESQVHIDTENKNEGNTDPAGGHYSPVIDHDTAGEQQHPQMEDGNQSNSVIHQRLLAAIGLVKTSGPVKRVIKPKPVFIPKPKLAPIDFGQYVEEARLDEFMSRGDFDTSQEVREFISSHRLPQQRVGDMTGLTQSRVSQYLNHVDSVPIRVRRLLCQWYLACKDNPALLVAPSVPMPNQEESLEGDQMETNDDQSFGRYDLESSSIEGQDMDTPNSEIQQFLMGAANSFTPNGRPSVSTPTKIIDYSQYVDEPRLEEFLSRGDETNSKELDEFLTVNRLRQKRVSEMTGIGEWYISQYFNHINRVPPRYRRALCQWYLAVKDNPHLIEPVKSSDSIYASNQESINSEGQDEQKNINVGNLKTEFHSAIMQQLSFQEGSPQGRNRVGDGRRSRIHQVFSTSFGPDDTPKAKPKQAKPSPIDFSQFVDEKKVEELMSRNTVETRMMIKQFVIDNKLKQSRMEILTGISQPYISVFLNNFQTPVSQRVKRILFQWYLAVQEHPMLMEAVQTGVIPPPLMAKQTVKSEDQQQMEANYSNLSDRSFGSTNSRYGNTPTTIPIDYSQIVSEEELEQFLTLGDMNTRSEIGQFVTDHRLDCSRIEAMTGINQELISKFLNMEDSMLPSSGRILCRWYLAIKNNPALLAAAESGGSFPQSISFNASDDYQNHLNSCSPQISVKPKWRQMKRSYFVFQPIHFRMLHKYFLIDPFPSAEKMDEMAIECNMAYENSLGGEPVSPRALLNGRIVAGWFKNRRDQIKTAEIKAKRNKRKRTQPHKFLDIEKRMRITPVNVTDDNVESSSQFRQEETTNNSMMERAYTQGNGQSAWSNGRGNGGSFLEKVSKSRLMMADVAYEAYEVN